MLPRRRQLTLLGLFACLLFAIASGRAASSAPVVVVLHLRDTIQPISEGYLERGIKRAASLHAQALLVELDTPGGLLDTTRSMVSAILASPEPVIIYVAPTGSRAGSAGFFLLEAADVAAMAPGTNAGAAHPVIEGGRLDPVMKQKLENDATAFLRSYTAPRDRNVQAAQDAVLNSKSYSAREALDLHLIDLIAPDESTLLRQIDGRQVKRFNGGKVTLHTAGAELVALKPTLRESILDRLVDPNFALLALVTGALLIYLEFNAPGTIVPGALGTLLVVLALFALNLLPIRYTAIMLLIGAFVLLLLEAKFFSHGVLAAAGIVCLIVGALTLVDAPVPELRIHLATAVSAGLSFGLITAFLARIAWRARRNKIITGPAAMVGMIGIAQQPLTPSGQILVHGELWQALATSAVAEGEQVRVNTVSGLTLLVERVP